MTPTKSTWQPVPPAGNRNSSPTTMTRSSAVGRRHDAIVLNSKPFIFARFPTEIVRLVFEASVTPGLRTGDEQQRQRTAYTYCLISKGVRVWVEPLLYEKAVLESRIQVKRFLRALEIKPASFLVRAVKTVWILNEHFPPESSDQLHIIFIKCPLLKRFAILDDWNYIRIMHNIPKPQSGINALQELTIVRASVDLAKTLTLPYLTIQKLILIDCAEVFFDTIHRRALEDKELLDTLRAIPHIYLEFITIPNVRLAYHLKFRAIPLWIQPSPESVSILHIRSSTKTIDPFIVHGFPRHDEEYFDDCELLDQVYGDRCANVRRQTCCVRVIRCGSGYQSRGLLYGAIQGMDRVGLVFLISVL